MNLISFGIIEVPRAIHGLHRGGWLLVMPKWLREKTLQLKLATHSIRFSYTLAGDALLSSVS